MRRPITAPVVRDWDMTAAVSSAVERAAGAGGISAPTVTLADVERNADRAWEEVGHWGRCAASALFSGHVSAAHEFAEQWAAADEWRAETVQQLRDVRRVAS